MNLPVGGRVILRVHHHLVHNQSLLFGCQPTVTELPVVCATGHLHHANVSYDHLSYNHLFQNQFHLQSWDVCGEAVCSGEDYGGTAGEQDGSTTQPATVRPQEGALPGDLAVCCRVATDYPVDTLVTAARGVGPSRIGSWGGGGGGGRCGGGGWGRSRPRPKTGLATVLQ